MNHLQSTVVARLSPPGKSAIACLGVAGPRAWDLVRAKFVRSNGQRLPDSPTLRSVSFGTLGDDATRADEVVLFVRQTEPTCLVEIDCHGGPEVVRMLESLLVANGAEVVSAEAWSKRHEGDDRAAMLDVLARCSTTRTAAIALDQVNGAFDRAVAEIEAPFDAERMKRLTTVGEHLVRPWKVVLAGAPNVGKSSLVNALAGFTRSVVNPTPGTTRDVVSTTIALDGWPIELLDTAGLRSTRDELEAEGIARADAARAEADLVVWVLDATSPPEEIPTSERFVVVNKIDQLASWDVSAVPLHVSARTSEGLDRLIEAIVGRLVPVVPKPGEALPITAAQRRRLAERGAAHAPREASRGA